MCPSSSLLPKITKILRSEDICLTPPCSIPIILQVSTSVLVFLKGPIFIHGDLKTHSVILSHANQNFHESSHVSKANCWHSKSILNLLIHTANLTSYWCATSLILCFPELYSVMTLSPLSIFCCYYCCSDHTQHCLVF